MVNILKLTNMSEAIEAIEQEYQGYISEYETMSYDDLKNEYDKITSKLDTEEKNRLRVINSLLNKRGLSNY